MDQSNVARKKPFEYIAESARELFVVLKSKYLYIGLITLGAGAALNFASQTYLQESVSEGKTLPMLSDLILDRLPVVDVSLLYDLFCLFIFATVIVYVIHKKDYNRLPFILLMCGLFFIVRGVFIVLTPFGNPPHFNGSDPIFNGFSRFDLGMYPSGHVGNSFLLLILVKDKQYRKVMWIWLTVIIVSLFLAHGHYSIDILSGFFFAYAIRSFGEKYLSVFELKKNEAVPSLTV